MELFLLVKELWYLQDNTCLSGNQNYSISGAFSEPSISTI